MEGKWGLGFTISSLNIIDLGNKILIHFSAGLGTWKPKNPKFETENSQTRTWKNAKIPKPNKLEH